MLGLTAGSAKIKIERIERDRARERERGFPNQCTHSLLIKLKLHGSPVIKLKLHRN